MKGYSYRPKSKFRVLFSLEDPGIFSEKKIEAIEYNISDNGDLTFYHYEPSDEGNYSELKPFITYRHWAQVEKVK